MMKIKKLLSFVLVFGLIFTSGIFSFAGDNSFIPGGEEYNYKSRR